MDHAHAAAVVVRGFRQESAEGCARLVLGHAVQVDLVADRVLAAPQAPKHRLGYSLAAESELVP